MVKWALGGGVSSPRAGFSDSRDLWLTRKIDAARLRKDQRGPEGKILKTSAYPDFEVLSVPDDILRTLSRQADS
jgi:hypothetical protein